MGDGRQATTFKLIGPVGTVIRTDRPTFRWQPLSGRRATQSRCDNPGEEPGDMVLNANLKCELVKDAYTQSSKPTPSKAIAHHYKARPVERMTILVTA
jgi:hypothetical protein